MTAAERQNTHKIRAKGMGFAIPRQGEVVLELIRQAEERPDVVHNGSLKRLPNSSRKPRKVRPKQMHQMYRHQLITPTFRVSLLVSQMGRRVQSSCPTRRRGS